MGAPHAQRVTRVPDAQLLVQRDRGQERGLAGDIAGGLAALLGTVIGVTIRSTWRYPFTTAAVVTAWVLFRTGGLLWLLASLGVIAGCCLTVGAVRPSWWARGRAWSLRYRRRRLVRQAWRHWCDRLGLAVVDVDKRTGARTCWTPGLSRLRWARGDARTATALTGRVSLLAGQCVDDLSVRAEKLAPAAGARSCRITATGTASADVTWLFGDPLAATVVPLPVVEAVDLAELPVGVREDGGTWRLRLAGTHVLVVGVTGAGKGSVIWSLLAALGPAITGGWVQVWAVDGKAGMELGPGRALFTRFATTVEAGVDLLEDAAAVMTQRAARLAESGARDHAPSVGEPLLVVLVDEVALLTAYVPDRKLRDRAEKALAAVATQGRAPGVVLVAALQDPRKEVLGLRNLFPTKIGMRLDEKTQVDMVLGDGARDAGAACHQIPESTPGVAYVRIDGVREPVRVRATWLDDTAVTTLAATYPAPGDASAASASAASAAAASDGQAESRTASESAAESSQGRAA